MAYQGKQILKIDGRFYKVTSSHFGNICVECDNKDDMLHLAKWCKEYSKCNGNEEKEFLKRNIEFETDTHIGTYEKMYPQYQIFDMGIVVLSFVTMKSYWKEDV